MSPDAPGEVAPEVHLRPSGTDAADTADTDGRYARYVLGVLLVVYVINFVDRQILAILAEDIKADLGVTDAQLGFLFGTAFAVFYATFGIAFGRLADLWNRKNLISVGLAFWSLMTAMSAASRGFLPLALCRFGVGVGEASASPAAFSMLYDYFSPRVRTTVLAVYSSGVYLGAGLGLFLGGLVLESWHDAWPDPAMAPLGLRAWQAAFIVVGVPGLVMTAWTATLREPRRGASEGLWSTPHPHPFRETALVLASMVPVANWRVLATTGPGRRIAVRRNLLGASAIAVTAWGLTAATGDGLQWTALALGVYAAMSWAQTLSERDPVVFGLMFRCRTLRNVIFAGGTTTFLGVAVGFWAVPLLQRHHGVSPAEAGTVVGTATALMGFIGIVLGGMLADRLRRHTPRGKLYVWLGGAAGSTLAALLFLTAENLALCYVGIFLMNLTGPMSHGPGVSTVNDLVVPRGRATASAFAFMVATFLGTALGPYLTGLFSDSLSGAGMDPGEALRRAMLWTLLLPVGGMLLVVLALRHLPEDERTLLARARTLGEEI